MPPLCFVKEKDGQQVRVPEAREFNAQEYVWIESTTGFLKWLKGVVNHVHPTEDNSVLLNVCCLSSYKDLEVIISACENHVHTIHVLWPLGRADLKPSNMPIMKLLWPGCGSITF